ncbi:MAG: 50S ribosomal protein L9 [Acidobacteria bacterium]|nr:50S ribosomal protein L9 [Acidobacteriota bacterium]MCB9397279.1 50S ribosomal protein L9 [Acidobacteriota bacterium]
MEVLLRESVLHLGKRGQVVKVKPGYARNYLLPKGLAVNVTEGNKRQIELERRNYERKILAEKQTAEEAKAQLEALNLTLKKRAGDTNHLFGSVTHQDIATLLKEKGFDIDRRKIETPTIRELGEFKISVRLHPEVVGEFTLNVLRRE